jgi:hypothetical protein
MRKHRIAILSLALGNLIFALFAVAPLSPPLAQALDHRPAAMQVADSADDGARAELLEDHPALTAIAVESALLALLVWGALSWIAAGGLLADEHFLLGCARHAGRMLAVGAVGLPLRLLGLAGPLLAWLILDAAHDFTVVVIGVVAGAVAGGGLWSLATVTIDRARGQAILRPELRPWQALRAGLAASRMRRGNTLRLAAVSGVGFAAVSALQLTATHWLPPTTAGLLIAFAIAAGAAICRTTLSTYVLLAANA